VSHQDEDLRHLDTLDRDLARISNLELATGYAARPIVATGLALVFVILAGIAAMLFLGQTNNSVIVVIAASLGAYMALNIGANDVANNMGPAVGANAISMGGAIVIAVIFESAGALLAGGEVVSTVAKGIIAPESMGTAQTFVWAMIAALLSAALWINLATWIGAPVSTTHSVVGGVMGAGIAAAGFAAVELDHHDRHRRKLGHLTCHGRCDCRAVPLADQVAYHLSGRQDRCRPHLGAYPCGAHGRNFLPSILR